MSAVLIHPDQRDLNGCSLTLFCAGSGELPHKPSFRQQLPQLSFLNLCDNVFLLIKCARRQTSSNESM